MAAREELVAVIKGDISDFKQKMAQVSSTTSSITEKFNKLTTGLFKIGLAGAAAYGALETFKKVAATSSEASDKLDFAVASVTGGLNQMGRQLITLDFSNFLGNVKEAANLSRELAERLDDLTDRNRSLSIVASETEATIAALREDAADPDQSITQASRISSIKEAIRLQQELSETQTENATRAKQIAADRLKQETGLGEYQLQSYYRNYNNIEDLRNEANKLNADYQAWIDTSDKESADKLLQKALNGGFLNLKGEIFETTELVAQMMLQIRKLGKGSDTSIDEYINSLVKLSEVSELNSQKMKTLNKQLKGLKPDEVKTRATEQIPEKINLRLTPEKPMSEMRVSIEKLTIAWQMFGDTVERTDVKGKFKDISQITINFGKELEYLAEGAVIALADSLGNALGKSLSGQKNSWQGFFDNFLTMVADWAINLGSLMVAAGIAASAFWKSLMTPVTAPLAIGLGIALISAGAAVKGAMSKNPMNSSGGGAGSSSGGGGSEGFDIEGFRSLRGGFKVEVNGTLTGRGRDLVAVLDQESTRKGL